MSYAKDLHRKLVLHSETDLIDIKDDIDDIIELADKSVDEYDEKVMELKKVEDAYDEAEPEVVYRDATSAVEAALSEWGLLGEQIGEIFIEIVKNPNCNQIKFLESLQAYNAMISLPKLKKVV